MSTFDDAHARPERPLALLPWMVLPLIPFMSALVALDLAAAHGFPLSVDDIEASAFGVGSDRTLMLFQALSIYLSIAVVQFIVCGALIYVCYAALKSEGPQGLKRAGATFGVLAISLVVICVYERARSGDALQLTYHQTCEVLLKSGVAPHLTPLPDESGEPPEDCDDGTTSNLAFLAVIPMGIGLLASTMAAAAATRVTSQMPAQATTWRSAFKERAEDLQLELYLTAGVLVTSTAAMMQFYRLPLEILVDDQLRSGLQAYGEGMTLFWGTIFTLTLFAIYGPTALEMRRQLRRHMMSQGEDEDLAGWTQEMAFLSFRRRLRNAFVALSPLLVGPVGALLETFLNAPIG